MKRWGAVLLGVFIAGSAFASLAPFNGEANTTCQSWTFSTGAVVSGPDVDGNDYGDPLATVQYSTPFSPYIELDGSHSGVWYIEDWVEFYIPNTGNDAPDTYKQVWIEMVYKGTGMSFFTVPGLSGGVNLEESIDLGDGYFRETYSFIIEPNPTEETIYLLPLDCTIHLDEIVIETICVPEPATLVLLGLGGLMLRKRKVA